MVKIRRWLAVFAVAAAVLAVIVPALASGTEEQQQELNNIQRQMQEQQNRSTQAQQQVDKVSDQLHVIQGELDGAVSDYKAIQDKLTATEQQIKTNSEVLAKAEKSLAERSQILNRRMRDIYENGQLNYLDVLLGSTDFSDFSTRMELLKRIISQDASLIDKVKAERELILQKKSQLETDRAAIVTLKQAAEAKKSEIEARKQERESVLHSAVSDRDAAERSYQELAETSRQIEEMIRRSQSGTKEAMGGSGMMMWPASGPITDPFGWRVHPIFGTRRFHTGIDIGADYGDPVCAADGGVVIYADWMGGYGKAVMIDHGGGITTLYGHNSELLVSEGQRVSKGQLIARVGATGYATGPHVHFEVRQNGTPVDPMGYLP